MGRGLLIHEVSRPHTTMHHIRWDSSRQVISPSQRPLPDNTQHSQLTSMPSMGFEPTISAGEWPQTHSLDRAATWIDSQLITKAKWPPKCPILNNAVVLHLFSSRVDDIGFVVARCRRSSDKTLVMFTVVSADCKYASGCCSNLLADRMLHVCVTGIYCLQQEKGDSEWLVTRVTVKITDVFMQITLQRYFRILLTIPTRIQKFGLSSKNQTQNTFQYPNLRPALPYLYVVNIQALTL